MGLVSPGTGTLTAPRSAVAARMASASSPAEPYRWAGSLASPRATTSSTAGGRPGRSVLGAGGTALSCAHMTATISPLKGWRPVRHSNSTQASEYTSA